jgi:hypothetical protein
LIGIVLWERKENLQPLWQAQRCDCLSTIKVEFLPTAIDKAGLHPFEAWDGTSTGAAGFS